MLFRQIFSSRLVLLLSLFAYGTISSLPTLKMMEFNQSYLRVFTWLVSPYRNTTEKTVVFRCQDNRDTMIERKIDRTDFARMNLTHHKALELYAVLFDNSTYRNVSAGTTSAFEKEILNLYLCRKKVLTESFGCGINATVEFLLFDRTQKMLRQIKYACSTI